MEYFLTEGTSPIDLEDVSILCRPTLLGPLSRHAVVYTIEMQSFLPTTQKLDTTGAGNVSGLQRWVSSWDTSLPPPSLTQR